MSNNWGNAIEQMKKQEEAGLTYLYSKTYNYVYLRAKSILKKEEDIQQLMKEVYKNIFQSAAELKEETVYEKLGKLVYTLGAQRFRKKKAREASYLELEKNELTARKGASADPAIYVIGSVLEELPDLYQATFYAFFYDFMCVTDIAEVMDCNVGTVLNRLNYTVKYVKKAIEIYNEEEGKSKKEKANFSVDVVCAALRSWSIDHCMGMATAQTLYGNICKELKLSAGSVHMEGIEFAGVNNTVVYHKTDDLSVLLDEISFYTKKETVDKRKVAMIAGAAAVVVILLVILIAALAGRDNDNKPNDNAQNQEQENDISQEEEKLPADDAEQNDAEQNDAENGEELEEDDSDSETNGDYILPTSNTAELTSADLEGLTKEQLRLARNEIYARHGMIFGVDDLDAYFRAKSWYEPKYKSSAFYDAVEMNMIEEANVKFILEAEKSR